MFGSAGFGGVPTAAGVWRNTARVVVSMGCWCLSACDHHQVTGAQEIGEPVFSWPCGTWWWWGGGWQPKMYPVFDPIFNPQSGHVNRLCADYYKDPLQGRYVEKQEAIRCLPMQPMGRPNRTGPERCPHCCICYQYNIILLLQY